MLEYGIHHTSKQIHSWCVSQLTHTLPLRMSYEHGFLRWVYRSPPVVIIHNVDYVLWSAYPMVTSGLEE